MISFARLASLTKVSQLHAFHSDNAKTGQVKPYSKENEIEAWNVIMKSIDAS